MATLSNTIKGYEILEFQDAEIIKSNDSSCTPIKGMLKVLFFPEINRFILMLNNIYYPLLRRLSIIGPNKSEMRSRTYILPIEDGCYTLKLCKLPNQVAIQNFETILSCNCDFFYEGEANPVRETEMTSGDFSTQSSENMPSTLEGAETKHLESTKTRKGVLAKAADTISRVLGGSSKNLNMTIPRNIEELMDVSQDFLTVCEFPRESIEECINCCMRATNMTQESVKSLANRTSQTTIKKVTITYPKEITEREQMLIREIQMQKELQDKVREKQQRQREKEMGFLNKERALQDELNNLRCEKMQIEIAQREQFYGKALVEKETTLQQQEDQFLKGRQNFINRENALRSEIENKIMELKKKEKLTQEEQAEFARREQELIDLNKRLAGERSEMERREQDLRRQAQTREAQIQDKEKFITAEREEFRRKQEELKELTKQRLMELQQKEKMTEAERAEFKRKQEELNQMNVLIEQERLRLESKQREVQAQGEREIHELQKKEKLVDAEKAEFARRQKELEAQVRARLDELNKKEKLTEAESKELQRKQKELNEIAKKTEAEQINLQNKEQRFAADISKKEAALREKERMTENERAELKSIKEKLKNEAKLTETERRDLESMRDKIKKEAEQREAEIIRREKLTENERMELQRKERDAEKTLQMRLEELRRKEMLTEKERVEMKQREEELTKITKIKEAELGRSKKMLDQMDKHTQDLIAQNQKIVQGHMTVQKDVAELQQELNKPIKEQVETTRMTTKKSAFAENRQRTEKGSKEIIGSQETTTSG